MTDTPHPDPLHSQELATVETATLAIVGTARAMHIETDEGLVEAARVLKGVAEMSKSLEERRTFFVKPLNDQVKQINALFKNLGAPLVEADYLLRAKVKDYRDAQAAIFREAQARMEAEAAAEAARRAEAVRLEQLRLDGEAAIQQAMLDEAAAEKGEEALTVVAPVALPPAAVMAPYVAPPKSKVGNMVGRKVWRFRVVQAELVPREFLYVDERMIRDAVREGVREIAGVLIYQEEEVSIR